MRISIQYKNYLEAIRWQRTYLERHMCSEMTSEKFDEEGTHDVIIDDGAGIVKAYEAVTQYCGFTAIEAGKTMGLSPYGKPNKNIPPIYQNAGGKWTVANAKSIKSHIQCPR